MKSVLLALALLTTSVAHADSVSFHGITWHGSPTYETESGEVRKYNNVNPGVSYRFDNGVGFGVYRNSHYKTSFHVNYTWLPYDNFGAFIGLATGYAEQKSHGLIGGLVLRTNSYNGWRLNLLGLPLGGDKSVFSLAISKEL